jgi:tetratricopeptide (TPR) repeat protein
VANPDPVDADELPPVLVADANAGRLVLFLGAGASENAIHPTGQSPPTASQLAAALAKEFLSASYKDRPLAQVAELAISETDLVRVQSFIRDLLHPFQPSPSHKLLPMFRWKAIATTNYDLLVERAYQAVSERFQTPVAFLKNGQRVEERLQGATNGVVFLKLHGCISDIEDQNCPLILTPDQYITHRHGRSRLFDRLKELAYEHSIVFIGHRLADSDIRAILLELDSLGTMRPRFYLVTPGLSKPDVRLWESRRVTCIDATFDSFITRLDSASPRALRPLHSQVITAHPIAKHFAVSPTTQLSADLAHALESDIEYLHSTISAGPVTPTAFYKGYFTDWGPIQQDLDIPRSVTQQVLHDLVFPPVELKSGEQDLVLIKGHAGAGKSVVLHRVAWELATAFDKLVVFLKRSGRLTLEPLRELHRLTQKRIYLFVDGLVDRASDVESLLLAARRERVPITLVGAERNNEWNVACGALESYLSTTHDVRYLSRAEIAALIDKLTEHRSLGHLAGMTREQQMLELEEHAGRQLLVALHEATFGKPFGDIILDEFNSITFPDAKDLYLTVAILHRLRAPARAGLISRIHGIPFKDFKSRLFEPLEFVVFARQADSGQDYVYETRHPHVAELVFERVLIDAKVRFAEYERIIKALDVDFSVDRDALLRLVNHRELRTLFPDASMIRDLYAAAVARVGEDALLLQQQALFEMHTDHGDLELAEGLLVKARLLMPRNRSLLHSQAELALRRSQSAVNQLKRQVHRARAREIAESMIQESPRSSFPHHTLLKAILEELEDTDPTDVAAMERSVASFERVLARAVGRFPDDEFIRDAEARFQVMLNERPQALATLERVFAVNRHSPYIASRLARQYAESSQVEKAIETLREGLRNNPSNKELHFQLATCLAGTPQGWRHPDMKFHLKRSFTTGDSNFLAQFWYARLLFLEGAYQDAAVLFATLTDADLPQREKRVYRGPIVDESDSRKRLAGTVVKLEAGYAFVEIDSSRQPAFAPGPASDTSDWSRLSRGSRATFELHFNYRGPVAVALQPE